MFGLKTIVAEPFVSRFAALMRGPLWQALIISSEQSGALDSRTPLHTWQILVNTAMRPLFAAS